MVAGCICTPSGGKWCWGRLPLLCVGLAVWHTMCIAPCCAMRLGPLLLALWQVPWWGASCGWACVCPSGCVCVWGGGHAAVLHWASPARGSCSLPSACTGARQLGVSWFVGWWPFGHTLWGEAARANPGDWLCCRLASSRALQWCLPRQASESMALEGLGSAGDLAAHVCYTCLCWDKLFLVFVAFHPFHFITEQCLESSCKRGHRMGYLIFKAFRILCYIFVKISIESFQLFDR